MADESHVKVAGDEKNGFIAEIHDGEVNHVFTGMFADAKAAAVGALKAFHEKFPDRKPAIVAAPVAATGGPVAPSTPAR